MSEMDISPFLEAKSDQVTADDLIGGPRTFRVSRVEVPGGEQPVLVHLEGMDGKPFKPCKGMRRLLAAMWGLNASTWAGRSITLFRDPDVRFGADQTGGVRVAAVSHIDEPTTVPVRVSRGKAKQYKIEPLKAERRSQTSDFSGQLAELKSLAKPGNMDALGAAWKEIGADARKALAAELPALKAACEEPAEDVAFDNEKPEAATTAQAKADGIIAEIEEAGAILDITTILSREQTRIESFPDELGVKIEVAADKRKRAIDAARETAVAK